MLLSFFLRWFLINQLKINVVKNYFSNSWTWDRNEWFINLKLNDGILIMYIYFIRSIFYASYCLVLNL